MRPNYPKKENKPIYPSIGIEGKTLDNSARVENFKYRNSNKKSTIEKLQELKIVGEMEKSVLTFQIYYCRERIAAGKKTEQQGLRQSTDRADGN